MSTKNKVYRIDLFPVCAEILEVIRDNAHLFSVPCDVDGKMVARTLDAVLDLYDDVVLDGSKDRVALSAYRAINNMTADIAIGLFHLAFGDYYKTVPAGYDVSVAEAMYRALNQDIVSDLCARFDRVYNRDEVELYVDDPLTEELLCTGLSYFDDAYALAQDAVSGLEKNPWLLYDLRCLRDQAVVKFGKDLRIVLFDEKYGNDRWSGEQYLHDGTKFTDVITDNIEKRNNRVRMVGTKLRKIR